MARKSAASLSVVADFRVQLPEPPQSMTDAQSRVWRAVVATKPVDWFQGDCMPVLAEYCRAVALAERLDALINEADLECLKSGTPELYKLLDARDKEVKRAASLAKTLRLTPQSRYTPQRAATENAKAGGSRPWGNRVIAHDPTGT